MRTDYLNPQIYNRLYGVMTYENVLALRVSLETGLRIDDVLSLRFDQLTGRTIRGTAEKTGKKYRKVISADLADRLRRLGTSGYIWKHRIKPNEHRTRQAVWANMKHAAELLGLTMNAAPHSARKTYAVEVFKDGGIEKAQKELQHDRISTTMLYCFSNMLTAPSGDPQTGATLDDEFIDRLADKIAEKVSIILQKRDVL